MSIWNFGRAKRTAQEEFWRWFIDHEEELFNFEIDRERTFDKLSRQLTRIDANLCFEFGPKQPRREIVLSAGGIKSAFPAVVALASAAPELRKFRVTAFRPRRGTLNVIEFREKSVDPKDVQFSLLDNGKIAGICLFVPGFRNDDLDLKQVGYLMLDEALGEYDVECKLGLIEMLPPEAKTNTERHPLADLPALFDQLVSQLERRTRKPS